MLQQRIYVGSRLISGHFRDISWGERGVGEEGIVVG